MKKIISITCGGQSFIDVTQLTPIQGNLKEKTREQLDKLKRLIIKRGFSFPFFIWQHEGINYTLDGHGRDFVCNELINEGYQFEHKDGSINTMLPIVYIDAENKKEAKAKLLELNSSYGKITEEGLYEFINEPDAEIDLQEIKVDLELMNVDMKHFELGYLKDEIPEDKLDDAPEPPAEATSKLGDIFLVDGRHRVMCGDSTKKEDVEKLMGGGMADMVFTDIPYGIDYSGGRSQVVAKKKYGKIKGDSEKDISKFIALINLNGYKNDAYIFVSPINLKPVFNSIENYDAVIVWKKTQPGLGYQWIRRYCEFAIFISKRKKTKEEQSEFDFWDIPTDPKKEYQHGTQKPIKVPSRAILFSSSPNEIVADWFLGSGSTLIACEQTNRICYGMELDPIYVDVILNRYHKIYPDKEIVCLNNPDFDFEKLFNV